LEQKLPENLDVAVSFQPRVFLCVAVCEIDSFHLLRFRGKLYLRGSRWLLEAWTLLHAEKEFQPFDGPSGPGSGELCLTHNAWNGNLLRARLPGKWRLHREQFLEAVSNSNLPSGRKMTSVESIRGSLKLEACLALPAAFSSRRQAKSVKNSFSWSRRYAVEFVRPVAAPKRLGWRCFGL